MSTIEHRTCGVYATNGDGASPAVRLAHPRTGALFESPVPPGQGWPDDPATARTPVATAAAGVVAMAEAVRSID
jgi:uracil-DNA glycosylase